MREKRQDYIDWDTTFLGVAAVMALRSKDPDTQNGACVVDGDHRVLSVGYNGLPRGMCDSVFSWDRQAPKRCDTKYPYMVHAEENAIDNCLRRERLHGATMYLYSAKGYPPCNECAKDIVNAGISRVVCASLLVENTDEYDWTPTMRMFASGGVRIVAVGSPVLILGFGASPGRQPARGSQMFERLSSELSRIAAMTRVIEEEQCQTGSTT